MKRFLLLMLIGLLCICPTIVNADEYTPQFNVGRNQSIPDLVAGETNHVSIKFANDSRANVQRLEISPQFDSETDYPFIINEMTTVKTKHGIDSKESFLIGFDFNVKKTAASGKYPYKLNLAYNTFDGSSGSQSLVVYLNIVNTLDQPSIEVTNVQVEGDVLASGMTQDVTFTLKNTSDVALHNIAFGFKELSANTIEIADQKDDIDLTSLEPYATETISFRMTAGNSVTGPYQSLIGNFSFLDEYDKSYEMEQAIRIPVEDAANYDAAMAFENIQLPETGVDSGAEFPIQFTLKNNDPADLRNVTVKIESDSGFFAKSTPAVHFQTLPSGGSENILFTMDSKSDIEAKTHALKLLVEYEIAGNQREYYEYVSVPIQHSGGNLSPKLILTDYHIQTEQVFAGEGFPIAFEFTNTSESKAIYNVKVTLSAADHIFTPVESSNSFFIDQLAVKQSLQKEIQLKANYNAEPQNHEIEVKMDYEDQEGKAYSTSDTVSVPVWQVLMPRVSKIDMPEFVEANMPMSFSFDIYNIGKAEIRNLFVEVVGDEVIDQQGEIYLGNLPEGSDTYYDGTLLFESEGEKTATVVIKYQDDAGNEFRETKDIQMTVEAPVPFDEEMMMNGEMAFDEYPMEQPFFSRAWVKWTIGFILLGAVLTGFVIFLKKRKARKQVEQYDSVG